MDHDTSDEYAEHAQSSRLTPEELERIYHEVNANMPSMSELIAKWIDPIGIVGLDVDDLLDDDDEDEDEDDWWFGSSDDEDEGFAPLATAAPPSGTRWAQLEPRQAGVLAEPGDAGTEAAFDEVVRSVGELVEALVPGQFIIVEFRAETFAKPFSQAAVNVDGFHCEVVSQEYISADAWPIDELWLQGRDWRMPDDQGGPNWRRPACEAAEVARVLVDGLRFGRVCPDPYAFAWKAGTFLGGGGDRVRRPRKAASAEWRPDRPWLGARPTGPPPRAARDSVDAWGIAEEQVALRTGRERRTHARGRV